jgi:hypothetical protein
MILAGSSAPAQNAATALLDSPVKIRNDTARAGEAIACSLRLGFGQYALFGLDRIPGTDPVELVAGELFGAFRIFHLDEGCNLVATWSTAFPSSTMSGITVDPASGGAYYWAADPILTFALHQFEMYTGQPGPAPPVLLPSPPGSRLPVWGPIAINPNRPGSVVVCEDIAGDVCYEIDLTSGALLCTFPNPDNRPGISAGFGNGLSEAASPGACGGATMVASSGTVLEGRVVRASQVDCGGLLCYDTWDLATPLGPNAFVNDIEEFWSSSTGGVRLALLENASSTAFVLDLPGSAADCQGIDRPASDVLYVNGRQGGSSFTERLDPANPIAWSIRKPPAGGSGNFVVHLDAGGPGAHSITTLPAGLGTTCYPFLIAPFGSATPVAVWNNLGRPGKVGASAYFGMPMADPPSAPTFFQLLPIGDPVNLPDGTVFTIQGVIRNPAATSPRGASVTNAIVQVMDSGI